MSVRFRNKDGKVNDHPSEIGCEGGTRDDIILDDLGVIEILTRYYWQQYGHKNPPDVTIHIQGGEILVEVEFTEVEDPIPL